jgi:sulfate adenylyltransferase subunit 1
MQPDTTSALHLITCGSVDDGKSTLIGRLLVDSESVLRDQLSSVQRQGQTDLALLTDGLTSEREQGITIDVAHRYFSTPRRKFVLGDCPGHEQYTRNMVTAASQAQAAVVLVDATKIAQGPGPVTLLPQTRRHSLLLQWLRVPHLIYAINKLDAVPDAEQAYARIREALVEFAQQAGLSPLAYLPVSALEGWNVVNPRPGWCGEHPSLLSVLESLPLVRDDDDAFRLPVQWVEKRHDSAVTHQGRRVFWGRVSAGLARVGAEVVIHPSGERAVVAEVLNAVREPAGLDSGLGVGQSAGVVLDREVDVSRGDWLLATEATDTPQALVSAQLAWLDNQPLQVGRAYWALHGHRWVKARVAAIEDQLDITTLERRPATELGMNAMGRVQLQLQQALPVRPYAQSRQQGAMILVDVATQATSAAVLVD